MKKLLQRIMIGLVAFVVLLTLIADLLNFSAGIPVAIAIFLLLAALVIYTCRYAGICCPHCEVRISGKYVQRLHRDGCVVCPRCGAIIERQ